MTTTELLRMARRSAADGHEREPVALYAPTPRILALMNDAADAERKRLLEDEAKLEMKKP